MLFTQKQITYIHQFQYNTDITTSWGLCMLHLTGDHMELSWIIAIDKNAKESQNTHQL